jgi:hypothetical protein
MSSYKNPHLMGAPPNLGDFVSNPIARLSFVIYFAPQTMVSVSIQLGATFAFVLLMAIDDWEPQFALNCRFEGVVFDAVCLVGSVHRH